MPYWALNAFLTDSTPQSEEQVGAARFTPSSTSRWKLSLHDVTPACARKLLNTAVAKLRNSLSGRCQPTGTAATCSRQEPGSSFKSPSPSLSTLSHCSSSMNPSQSSSTPFATSVGLENQNPT